MSAVASFQNVLVSPSTAWPGSYEVGVPSLPPLGSWYDDAVAVVPEGQAGLGLGASRRRVVVPAPRTPPGFVTSPVVEMTRTGEISRCEVPWT